MGISKKLLAFLGMPVGHQEWRRFKVPAVPELDNLPSMADAIVEATLRIEGVTLDHTPESLREVDRLLLTLREDGLRVRHLVDPIFCFGCYVGEVMRRHLGAEWAAPPSPMLGMFPVVRIGSDNYSAPIAKAYKRVQLGPEESVYDFYRSVELDVPRKVDESLPSTHEGI
ncbi:MAG: hypothetical protein KF838_15200 [Phycisphaeraceae bacterium]|nr:MAG: hypothetical protein KF838_15200 [Phycisphaeraceae bacterium]